MSQPCLADFLSSLPNLVKISLLDNYSPEIGVKHQLTNLPQLLHLKELRVNTDFNLFEKARNLESVTAQNISSIRFLTDTIWKQRHLKSLDLFILTELAITEFLDSIPNEVCMSLRKLKINIEFEMNLQPLVKFLKTQNELEELELKIDSCVIDRNFLHTLLNMKSLRNLTLKFHNVTVSWCK